MATLTQTARSQPQTAVQSGYPKGGLRFDWTAVVLSCIFIAGLWLDGWAHFHGRTDNTFFTPWHFLFYSAFGLTAGFVGYNQWRNQNRGYLFRQSLPRGYWLSLIGVAVFAVGGVGDMIWHILFGIEGGTEALTSPTHLMLGVGMALVFTGPLRAAWIRSQEGDLRGWRSLGPAIISATLLLALLFFFTSYAHPLVNPLAINTGASTTTSQNPVDQVYIMNADGRMQTRLTAFSDNNLGSADAAWSPDGKQMVYAYGNFDFNQGQTDLYTMNADGTNPVQLTNGQGLKTSPVWSPDGKQIAYITSIDGKGSVFVISPHGGEATRLTTDDNDYIWPAWSPDSHQIAVTRLISGNQGEIDIINADGSDLKPLTSDGSSFASIWSPDGSKIAFTRRLGNNNYDIYLMNTDGSGATRLTTDSEFDLPQAFSSDGKQLYFTSERKGPTQIFVMPIAGEGENGVNAQNLSNNPDLQIGHAAVSPDGSKILFSASLPSSGNNSGVSPQDFGVTAVLLQAGLIASMLVLLIWKWRLPFGALTLVFSVTAFMITLLTDLSFLVPGALIAGLIADILIWRWNPSPQNETAFHRFAFIVPLVYFALYFLAIQLLAGIGWHIHVWGGAIFLSGVIGLLLSYLVSVTATSRPAISSLPQNS